MRPRIRYCATPAGRVAYSTAGTGPPLLLDTGWVTHLTGQLLEAYYGTNIRGLLPAVRARTAVLHREADPATRFRLGREVATLIPGAALVPLPGTSHLFSRPDGVDRRQQLSAAVMIRETPR